MKVCTKSIKMIAYFEEDGKIIPIRFKIEEDDKCQVVKIEKIISTDKEKLCGNIAYVFTCNVIINGIQKTCEIKYLVEECKWIIFKI